MRTERIRTDVLIIGGGTAGCFAAYVIGKKSGRKVLIAEKANIKRSGCLARGSDVVLIDTAGRLQTKVNLMEELAKISRVVKKVIPDAPHQTILVLDATTGQNAVSQAQNFGEIVPLTGVVLTKLDGTAKGGVVLSIHEELHVPIRWIGLGEREDDLQRFNALEFVKALFETEDHILSQSTKV